MLKSQLEVIFIGKMFGDHVIIYIFVLNICKKHHSSNKTMGFNIKQFNT